ncbi:VOC family protein [Nocardia vinacea]|uniref:VOC family protein n=1 Tax=Nocardia vinacea TaxID=96468 RepID=UPI000310C182|nr:glyoxalase/bleomycin resistance/dioxygenase family protein [Nocardia vinacea]
MSNITAVIARVVVADLDQAIPLYQGLSGSEKVNRFGFAGVELASIGPFLLLAGPDAAAYANRTATLLVKQITPVIDEIERAGGQILEGPAPGPNGDRLIARNPDGAIFEYIQVTAAAETTHHGESR